MSSLKVSRASSVPLCDLYANCRLSKPHSVCCFNPVKISFSKHLIGIDVSATGRKSFITEAVADLGTGIIQFH